MTLFYFVNVFVDFHSDFTITLFEMIVLGNNYLQVLVLLASEIKNCLTGIGLGLLLL